MTENSSSGCSVQELTDIITFPSGGLTMLPSEDLNEVYPNIYIGDESSANNVLRLQRLGITHVLNTAMGPKDPYHINRSHVFYQKAQIRYLGVKATDTMNFPLNKTFKQTAEFIDEALKSDGKVLVHCIQGVSRSATTVLAFLMQKRHLPAQDAVRSVRAAREISPNHGFLQQLCDLNDRLAAEGHFGREEN